ncbi:L-Ala-D/L-Glu epimerase [Methyloligella halotolerans]|uniref:Dipeptide epimerase n=1 Tax=Methyloligella halotolerans TaxID=1177755 RepID=A0A1E2S328_9HYPH|nr:N-acetyl-D-Glu racemase DgcA [Methyloligella halotolerans]ODA68916.1 L-Ala-D/L-Glu epimerase [Methyloligella halotolerans]
MSPEEGAIGRQPRLAVVTERWPIRGGFSISRGSKDFAEVAVATLASGDAIGRGECVPYGRYGESMEGVVSDIHRASAQLTGHEDRAHLQDLLPPGAARNALDCALWDLEAKLRGKPAYALAGLAAPEAVETAFTISLDTPEAMAAKAKAAAQYPLLKLKLGGDGDEARLAAIREAAPSVRLIADANEAWRPDNLEALMAAAGRAGVELIEQPLPAGEDAALAGITHHVPVCADESVHDREGLRALAGRYDAINIKLDKTGGLTEALALLREAQSLDLKIMVGCMVSTSLAMAPAMLLAQQADWVDLDGPLLLAEDRLAPLAYRDGKLQPPEPALWG